MEDHAKPPKYTEAVYQLIDASGQRREPSYTLRIEGHGETHLANGVLIDEYYAYICFRAVRQQEFGPFDSTTDALAAMDSRQAAGLRHELVGTRTKPMGVDVNARPYRVEDVVGRSHPRITARIESIAMSPATAEHRGIDGYQAVMADGRDEVRSPIVAQYGRAEMWLHEHRPDGYSISPTDEPPVGISI